MELPELRQKVGALDKQILKLISDRLETTKAIGEIKQKRGLPIRDFKVEVQVLKRARERAREVGLDERAAEEIAELLMRTAVQTQAELPPVTHTSPRKWVHVVGGHGRMGTWLTRFFESQGHRVSITDPSDGPFSEIKLSLSEAAGQADVIVLATNLSATPKILRELLTLIPQEHSPLVFDIASLKTELIAPLREAAGSGLRLTSLHPMFAPGAVLLSGRAVLVCDAGNREATDEAKSLFTDTALGLYEVPLEEHDRLMTVVLGMSHLINLIFGRAVSRSDFSFDLLGKIASTTFAKQIKTAAEVAEENPFLYHEIQFFNTYTEQMLNDVKRSLAEFSEAAKAPDGARFHALMKETSQYLRLDNGNGEQGVRA
jgi:chorismate mutase / prephenate dehydrogenase